MISGWNDVAISAAPLVPGSVPSPRSSNELEYYSALPRHQIQISEGRIQYKLTASIPREDFVCYSELHSFGDESLIWNPASFFVMLRRTVSGSKRSIYKCAQRV